MFNRRFHVGGEANYNHLSNRVQECVAAVSGDASRIAIQSLAHVVGELLSDVMDYMPYVKPLYHAASTLVGFEGHEVKGLVALSLASQFAHNPRVGFSSEERQKVARAVIEASHELLQRKSSALSDQYLAIHAIAGVAQQERDRLYLNLRAAEKCYASICLLPREHRLALSRHLAKKAMMGAGAFIYSWAKSLQDIYLETVKALPDQARAEALFYALKDTPSHGKIFGQVYQGALVDQLKRMGFEEGHALAIANAAKEAAADKTDEPLSRLAWQEARGVADAPEEKKGGRAKEIISFCNLIHGAQGRRGDGLVSAGDFGDGGYELSLFTSTLSSVCPLMQRYLALDVAFHEGMPEQVQRRAWNVYKRHVEQAPDLSDRIEGYHVALNRARAQEDRLGGEPGLFLQEAKDQLIKTLEGMNGSLCMSRLQTIIEECRDKDYTLKTRLQSLFLKKVDDLLMDKRAYALAGVNRPSARMGAGRDTRYTAALDRW